MRVTLPLIASFLLHLAVLSLVGSALLTLRGQPASPGVVVIEVGLYPLPSSFSLPAQKEMASSAPTPEDSPPTRPESKEKEAPSQSAASAPHKMERADFQITPDLNAASVNERREWSLPLEQAKDSSSSRPSSLKNVGAIHEMPLLPPAAGSQVPSQDKGDSTVDDLRPRCLFCPWPEYPLRARREGWEGQVEVVLVVREDGTVGSVDLRRSSGYRILDRAALKVAQQSRFTPALRQGVPAVVRGRIRYQFRLVREGGA